MNKCLQHRLRHAVPLGLCALLVLPLAARAAAPPPGGSPVLQSAPQIAKATLIESWSLTTKPINIVGSALPTALTTKTIAMVGFAVPSAATTRPIQIVGNATPAALTTKPINIVGSTTPVLQRRVQ